MRLKVLSYNIHKGFSIFNRRFVLEHIKESIRLLGPDIVCMQEVQGDHDELKKSVPAWPTEAQFEYLADTIWPHHAYGKNAVYPQGHHGNALLSKHPIKRWHNLDLSLDKSEMRGLLHAELAFPEEGRTLHVLNTHINLLHSARVKQFEKINLYIKDHLMDRPFILMGDFNDWRLKLDDTIRTKLKCTELFHELYGKHAQTFPCFYPTLPLDRIYIRGVKSIQGMVLKEGPWDELSDHLPIYAEVEF